MHFDLVNTPYQVFFRCGGPETTLVFAPEKCNRIRIYISVRKTIPFCGVARYCCYKSYLLPITPMLKHRVTFFNPSDSSDGVIDTISANYLKITPKLDFSREDRYRVPHTDLPPAIKLIRLQWSKPTTSKMHALFAESETALPGLQINAVPEENVEQDEFYAQLNQYVADSWGLGASWASDWISNTNSVFSYHINGDLTADVAQYVEKLLAGEKTPASVLLGGADHLDLIVDSEITIVRTLTKDATLLESEFLETSPNTRHEIGIFILDKKVSTVDDLLLSGVRFIIDPLTGEPRDKLEETFFHVKERHRILPDVTLEVSVEQPQGLHPNLQYTISNSSESLVPVSPDAHDCQLFYYQKLPKSYFIDKYQLPKKFAMVSLFGDLDLEAPEYNIAGWGSESLMSILADLADFDFTIHSRYQRTVSEEEADSVVEPIYGGNLFYACTVQKYPHLLKSPFDYTSSLAANVGGFQSYFTEDTVYYHVTQKEAAPRQLDIAIPRGTGDANEINLLTSVVLGSGLLLLLYKFITIYATRLKATSSIQKKTQ